MIRRVPLPAIPRKTATTDTAPQSQLALPVTADAARDGDLVLHVNPRDRFAPRPG